MVEKEILGQIERLIRGHKNGPRHTVAAIVKRYLASVEFGNLKAKADEERRFRLHLLPHLADDIAAEVDFDRMAWYREQRKEEKCLNGRDVVPSPATRNREVRQLSASFTWAVKYKLLTVNPIRAAPMEDEDSQRKTMPEAADVKRVLKVCKPRLRAMVAMTFGSGMRRAELCSLRLTQIDWETGHISLHGRDTKTGRPRVTVMTKRASFYLKIYLDNRDAKSPYVFCTSTGRSVDPRNFLRDFQEACRRVGLTGAAGERMWLHDLRAGFIGHHMENLHTSQRVVMDMTGHRTHNAFDRYVRVQPEWIAAAKTRADDFDDEKPDRSAGKRKPPKNRTPRNEDEK